MTLDFLDDVFRLNLALKTTKSILEGFAFLNSNFCQVVYTSKPAKLASLSYALHGVHGDINLQANDFLGYKDRFTCFQFSFSTHYFRLI